MQKIIQYYNYQIRCLYSACLPRANHRNGSIKKEKYIMNKYKTSVSALPLAASIGSTLSITQNMYLSNFFKVEQAIKFQSYPCFYHNRYFWQTNKSAPKYNTVPRISHIAIIIAHHWYVGQPRDSDVTGCRAHNQQNSLHDGVLTNVGGIAMQKVQ